jgi:hypothetical protein
VCLWGHFQRWLDHKGSELMNILLHGWIQNFNRNRWSNWKVGHSWRNAGAMPLKGTSWPWPLPVTFLCFLVAMSQTAFVACYCHHDILPWLWPKTMGPASHRLKPLKPWAKVNLSSFKLLLIKKNHNKSNTYMLAVIHMVSFEEEN